MLMNEEGPHYHLDVHEEVQLYHLDAHEAQHYHLAEYSLWRNRYAAEYTSSSVQDCPVVCIYATLGCRSVAADAASPSFLGG